MSVFTLPDLGEGLGEAEIVEWLVQPGDTVGAGQPVVLVETDKAQVEVTSPQSGRIARLRAEPGARVSVGAALLEFEDSAEAEPAEDAGTVVGELPRAPVAAGAAPPPASPGRVAAPPAVRALARDHGVDLSQVVGSGPSGSIRSTDVLQAAGAEPRSEGFESLRGVRLAMARNMTRAREVIPAGVSDEADVEAWADSRDVTIRLIRALVSACATEPALNAWFEGSDMRRRLHAQVDLALAVQTSEGLFAPVLRNAGQLDASALRSAIDALHTGARERSLRPEDLRDATITLSNFGSVGGRHASLVIVPPQVAILGAGRVDERVVAADGSPVVHRVLPLSLTFDHRAVAGAEAARFLRAVIEDLERPE